MIKTSKNGVGHYRPPLKNALFAILAVEKN